MGDNCPTQLTLANKINDFFISLTEPFTPLKLLVASSQEVPAELLVSETEVLKALSAVKIGKAVGPDSIQNKILKEFAVELAPIVQDIFNASLSQGDLPDLLKASISNPIPKISPPQQIEKDLRPLKLTCTLAKVMEELYETASSRKYQVKLTLVNLHVLVTLQQML